LTDEVLTGFNLSERQVLGFVWLRSEGRLTSGKYQELTGISRQTATRDMEDMVKKGILERHGERRGAFYVKAKEMPHEIRQRTCLQVLNLKLDKQEDMSPKAP